MEEIHAPVWMTGLTTVAGFMALMTSFLPVISRFGLYAGIGVAILTGASLTSPPPGSRTGRPLRSGSG